MTATASARKRPSSNCRSRRASPASRCSWSPASCANCTGTRPPPNGPISSEGAVRTTVVDPYGCSETNDFGPGDLWYFPRGHGHVIQTLGDRPCHFILVFDNGYFSEFGTFSITDWMGHAPAALLAKNFGLPGGPSRTSPRRRSISPGADPAGHAARAVAGREAAAADPQAPPSVAKTLRDIRRRARMAGRRLALRHLDHDDRRRPGDGARRAQRRCTGTPTPPNGNTSSPAPSRSRCSALRDAGGRRRCKTATSATSRKGSAIRSRMSAPRRAASSSSSTAATTRRSTSRNGSPAIRPTCSRRTSGQASVFEKFPRKDVFMTK